jgi:hypothetical protein
MKKTRRKIDAALKAKIALEAMREQANPIITNTNASTRAAAKAGRGLAVLSLSFAASAMQQRGQVRALDVAGDDVHRAPSAGLHDRQDAEAGGDHVLGGADAHRMSRALSRRRFAIRAFDALRIEANRRERRRPWRTTAQAMRPQP